MKVETSIKPPPILLAIDIENWPPIATELQVLKSYEFGRSTSGNECSAILDLSAFCSDITLAIMAVVAAKAVVAVVAAKAVAS